MDLIETVVSITFLALVPGVEDRFSENAQHFLFYYMPCACQNIKSLNVNALMKKG